MKAKTLLLITDIKFLFFVACNNDITGQTDVYKIIVDASKICSSFNNVLL